MQENTGMAMTRPRMGGCLTVLQDTHADAKAQQLTLGEYES